MDWGENSQGPWLTFSGSVALTRENRDGVRNCNQNCSLQSLSHICQCHRERLHRIQRLECSLKKVWLHCMAHNYKRHLYGRERVLEVQGVSIRINSSKLHHLQHRDDYRLQITFDRGDIDYGSPSIEMIMTTWNSTILHCVLQLASKSQFDHFAEEVLFLGNWPPFQGIQFKVSLFSWVSHFDSSWFSNRKNESS